MTQVFVQGGDSQAFKRELQARTQGTSWASYCASRYLDARGCSPTHWPGLTFTFGRRTRHFNPQSYSLALVPERWKVERS